MPKHSILESLPRPTAGLRLPTPQERTASQRRLTGLAVVTLLLLLGFAKPLVDLVRFAAQSDLYSHILLIPFLSAYLIWVNRESLAPDPRVNWRTAAIPLVAGIGLLAAYTLALWAGWQPPRVDHLTLMTCAFLLLFLSGVALFLGSGFLARSAFALAFLVFVVPFPTIVLSWLESFFQHGSAEVAFAFLWASGVPMVREGLIFHLPGFSLAVAPECSGIHSSLVLFITSLLAGHLFLSRLSNRALLTLAVIPLALVRNGFRIFTIAQLCVQVSPDMIESPIHRRGGPIFFALSLIPFFFLLLYLRKREARGNREAQ